MIKIKDHFAYNKLYSLIKSENKYRNSWEEISVANVPVEFKSEIEKSLNESCILTTTVLDTNLLKYIDTIFSYEINKLSYSKLVELLGQHGFEPVEHVSKESQFTVKGDVIIFWPSIYNNPIKCIYFDEELESSEIIDISINKSILPISILHLGEEQVLQETNFSLKLVNEDRPVAKKVLYFNQFLFDADIEFDFKQPMLFFQRFDLLENYIFQKRDYNIEIYTKREAAIPDKLKKYIVKGEHIASGIESKFLKQLILTDREIFGTIFLTNEVKKNISSTQSRKILAQFEGEVEIGDFVVHEDHGIGIYSGIHQEESRENETQNYIHIKYAEEDEILLPLNMVYKITKYIGTEGKPPEVTRLGKGNWEKKLKQAKASVQLTAGELARHYAKIDQANAHPIDDSTTEMYKSFVDKFEFEETPDQLSSIKDVLSDLENKKPMNRLLIGDVGFGKTEVIMRAAFKVAEAGKQVAILAPTTVLVSQHSKKFKDRFKDFPIRVESVSRFNDKYKNKDIIEDTKSGKVNILIGTHRLLSNDISFQKLGLIVVDEEQKFGVKQKEKLKKLQYGAHVLLTTATPIPRTLSMALSSIQDISVIQTPPKGRKAVKVDVAKLEWNKVVTSINKELERDGQIFIIHNSIKSISSVAARLRSLMPHLKIEIAHGRMSASKIENIMQRFLDGEIDCLLSTTIIENGIDIESVNTLIVLKAQNFGLSQLYQLKGRVGRSKKQAYAYFFYDGTNIDEAEIKPGDDESTIKKKSKDYIKRLKALKETDGLGAAFEIASKDLEIRGAGNLLGKEQHGQMNKIGYGLYMQMLAQEIEKLKNSS